MIIKNKYNDIFFTQKFIDKELKPQLPDSYIKEWDIKIDVNVGGIRIKDDTIDGLYLADVSVLGHNDGTLKFINTDKGLIFDSIYVRRDSKYPFKYDEYRYNINHKLIGTYNYIQGFKYGTPFCTQYKNDVEGKKYIGVFNDSEETPKAFNKLIEDGVITKFNLEKTYIDYFYTEGDIEQKYYIIK